MRALMTLSVSAMFEQSELRSLNPRSVIPVRFRSYLTLFFVLLVVHLCFAQELGREGWVAMTASHSPLWVAQERGLFTKQGLPTESSFFGAGPPAMQALVAGDLDSVVTSAPNVVNPRLRGADFVIVLSIIPTF